MLSKGIGFFAFMMLWICFFNVKKKCWRATADSFIGTNTDGFRVRFYCKRHGSRRIVGLALRCHWRSAREWGLSFGDAILCLCLLLNGDKVNDGSRIQSLLICNEKQKTQADGAVTTARCWGKYFPLSLYKRSHSKHGFRDKASAEQTIASGKCSLYQC